MFCNALSQIWAIHPHTLSLCKYYIYLFSGAVSGWKVMVDRPSQGCLTVPMHCTHWVFQPLCAPKSWKFPRFNMWADASMAGMWKPEKPNTRRSDSGEPSLLWASLWERWNRKTVNNLSVIQRVRSRQTMAQRKCVLQAPLLLSQTEYAAYAVHEVTMRCESHNQN